MQGESAGAMVTADCRSAAQGGLAARLEFSGINHFDTSAVYAAGASEVNLGRALRELSADVLVTTKADITPEALLAQQIQRGIRRTVEGSLVRCAAIVIDILLLHNPLRFFTASWCAMLIPTYRLDDFWGEGGFMEEAVRLKTEGKVRYVGISAHEVNPALAKAVLASGTIAVFNQQFNVVNPTAALPVPGRKPAPPTIPQSCARSRMTNRRRASEQSPTEATGTGLATSRRGEGVCRFRQRHRIWAAAWHRRAVTSPLAAGLLVDGVHERGAPRTSNPTLTARWEAAHRFYMLAKRHGDHGLSGTWLSFRAGHPWRCHGRQPRFATIQEAEAAADYAARRALPAHIMDDTLCRIEAGIRPVSE